MIPFVEEIMYEGGNRMKVIAINGSPRKNGNVTRCLQIMAKESIDPPETHKRTFTSFIR